MTFAINTHRFSVKGTALFGSHVLAAHHQFTQVARGAPASGRISASTRRHAIVNDTS
jgi:hypothetical protein